MIQIRNDALQMNADPLPCRKVTLIGVGTAGVNVLDQMVLDGLTSLEMIVFDTDRQVLTGSVVPSKELIGAKTTRGLGVGGDHEFARELAFQDRERIRQCLRGVDLAVVITGLGGGSGTGLTPEILKVLREGDASTIVLAVTPFSFEGNRRLSQAKAGTVGLRDNADVVLVFANERLSRIPEAQHNVREGFRAMNRILGDTAQSISNLLATRALMQLSLADLQTLAGRRHGGQGVLENCWVGVATASGIDRQKKVVERALSGPLFSDSHVWRNGDRILASVVGGPDMSVSDFQKVMQILQRELPVEFPMVAGAAVDETLEDRMMLTLLVARSSDSEVAVERIVPEVLAEPVAAPKVQPIALPREEPVEVPVPMPKPVPIPVVERKPAFEPAAEEIRAGEEEEAALEEELPKSRKGRDRGKTVKEQRYFSEQDELPLDNKVLRGRFEKAVPTMFNGQNLDQPTFMRLKMRLRISPED